MPKRLRVASYNACSLRAPRAYELVAKQFADESLAVVGIQEARPKCDKLSVVNNYLVVIAAADSAGRYGCQLWLSLDKPWAGDARCNYKLKERMVATVVAEPRLLVVRVVSQAAMVLFVVAHAPHINDTVEMVSEYWKEFECKLLAILKPGEQMVLLIDANAQLRAEEAC